MDLFYATIDSTTVGLVWASSLEVARDKLELALAEEGIYDEEDLDVQRFDRSMGPLILDLEDLT